jgi:hypothetical protein
VSDATTPAPRAPAPASDLVQLVRRAQAGDRSALPEVRRLLQLPKVVELLAGDDLARREAILRKLELLRAELAGPGPSPVERLLVERAVACWLQVQDADVRYAQVQPKGPSPAHNEFLERRMDRAHRRYLSALRTLATVRKLAVSVLQVNIAGKQQVSVVSAKAPAAGLPGGGPVDS